MIVYATKRTSIFKPYLAEWGHDGYAYSQRFETLKDLNEYISGWDAHVVNGFTREEAEKIVDEYQTSTVATVDRDGRTWTITTPEDTYIYTSLGKMLEDMRYTINEWRKEA